MKPDLLVVWPIDTDFPLFRYNLTRYAMRYFNRVIVGISNNNTGTDYTEFFKNNIPGEVISIPPTPPGQDWRSFATNILLKHSDADYVLFTEPDFFPKDERFYEVLCNQTEYDFIYYEHPSFVGDDIQHVVVALNPGDQLGPNVSGWDVERNRRWRRERQY